MAWHVSLVDKVLTSIFYFQFLQLWTCSFRYNFYSFCIRYCSPKGSSVSSLIEVIQYDHSEDLSQIGFLSSSLNETSVNSLLMNMWLVQTIPEWFIASLLDYFDVLFIHFASSFLSFWHFLAYFMFNLQAKWVYWSIFLSFGDLLSNLSWLRWSFTWVQWPQPSLYFEFVYFFPTRPQELPSNVLSCEIK